MGQHVGRDASGFGALEPAIWLLSVALPGEVFGGGNMRQAEGHKAQDRREDPTSASLPLCSHFLYPFRRISKQGAPSQGTG